jgi:hypothetical protein
LFRPLLGHSREYVDEGETHGATLVPAAVDALALVAVLARSARAATAAAPTGDFAVGGGTTVTFPYAIVEGLFRYQNIVVDAHSDPSGANAGGTVSFEFALVGSSTSSVLFTIGGPVTCLAVSGNDAIIVFNDVTSGFGPVVVHVIDNGSSGSRPDEFFSDPISPSTNCAEIPPGLHGGPLVSGDLVVHDAVVPTSTQQCHRRGWQHLVDDNGKPFRNQGLCVAFVATHRTR